MVDSKWKKTVKSVLCVNYKQLTAKDAAHSCTEFGLEFE